jgi:very-short-patch-repair endonuclease
MPAAQITRLARISGRGQLVLPAIYALTTGPLTRRQQLVAALLHGGPEAQLAGLTCLEVRNVKYAPRVDTVFVLTPMSRRLTSPGFVHVTRTVRLPSAHHVKGLRVSPPARAAIDACRSMRSVRDAVALLAEVVQRGMCTVGMLGIEVEAGQSDGSAVPRRAVAALQSGAASAPEVDLIALVATSTLLPTPKINQALTVRGQRYVPDLCWPDARLIVEVDSVEHHGFGPDAERTAIRRAKLTAAGWTVISISPWRIITDPAGVLRDIEAAYLVGLEHRAG